MIGMGIYIKFIFHIIPDLIFTINYLIVRSFEFHFDVTRQLAGKVDVIFINRCSILSGVRDQTCVQLNTQLASALLYLSKVSKVFMMSDESIGR